MKKKISHAQASENTAKPTSRQYNGNFSKSMNHPLRLTKRLGFGGLKEWPRRVTYRETVQNNIKCTRTRRPHKNAKRGRIIRLADRLRFQQRMCLTKMSQLRKQIRIVEALRLRTRDCCGILDSWNWNIPSRIYRWGMQTCVFNATTRSQFHR